MAFDQGHADFVLGELIEALGDGDVEPGQSSGDIDTYDDALRSLALDADEDEGELFDRARAEAALQRFAYDYNYAENFVYESDAEHDAAFDKAYATALGLLEGCYTVRDR